MGMAATQARYLALQARRSNLEYQGQQINQERSILSQQCTAMYNSLLAMTVPTPPSTQEYTKLVYSGTDGATSFDIGTVKPYDKKDANGDIDTSLGDYIVELTTQAVGNALSKDFSTVSVKMGDKYSGVTKYSIDENGNYTEDPNGEYILTPEGTYAKYTPTYDVIESFDGNKAYTLADASTLTDVNIDGETIKIQYEWSKYYDAIRNSFSEFQNASDEEIKNAFYVYFERTTREDGSILLEPKFVLKSDADAQINKANMYVNKYSFIPNGTVNRTEQKEGCELEFDHQGMITRIGLPNGEGGFNWHKVTATRVTDDKAYQEALNQYEYAQYEYDKKQQEINAKTEIIQQEDRNLELKLQRLDTERQQIQAEIDALKTVIKDNIDKSFKTFSG